MGQQGRVIVDGRGATNIRSNPGGEWIGDMPEGAIFDVIGGPFCLEADSGNDIRWYQIRYNGITGWSPEASNNTYFLEPYGGGSGGNSGGSSSGSSGSDSNTSIAVSVPFNPWGTTYVLHVNRETCVVENGSDVLAAEITRFATWISQRNGAQRIRDAFEYLRPAIPVLLPEPGEVEAFRHEAVERVQSQTGCSGFYYLVGSRLTDSSGLGNVMYGFFTERYAVNWEEAADAIANGAQIFSSRDWMHFYDNTDDLNQRIVGQATARRMSGNSISSSTFEGIAEQFNLR